MKALLIFLVIFSFCARADEISDLEVSPDSHQKIRQIQIKDLSDLQQLTPFKSISVIQKRYLPKTFRGEFNLSISSIINHTFLYFGGLSARVGFFVREDHGFGIEVFGQIPALKFVARDLIRANDLFPFIDIMPQLYAGAYYKWSPVFGKFSVIDQKIIYFDTYMTLGLGVMKVTDGYNWVEKWVSRRYPSASIPDPLGQGFSTINPALSLGFGQVFAITQDWAFNWELKSLYSFLKMDNGDWKKPWNLPVNIDLSLGMNYYFPGAKYR